MIPLPEFEGSMREASQNSTTDMLIFDLAINFAFPLVAREGLEKACEVLIRARRESGKPVAVVLYSRACDPGDLTLEEILRSLRRTLLEAGVAVFPSMPRTIRAIAKINS